MPLTENQITGTVARALRDQIGLTQTAFWSAVGVKQSVGCRYESDMPIPHPVRILIVARYVSGVQIDTGTPEGVAELSRLGGVQATFKDAKKAAAAVRSALDAAAIQIQRASDKLANI